jgi:aminoglycoside N3'-acetyltransferase
MEIFNSSTAILTHEDLSNSLSKLDLAGKDVIIYSRLLSFGRIKGINAVNCFIDLLLDYIGPGGTLIIPTYTLNTYSEKFFNVKTSKIMSGVLGEAANKNTRFTRTVHPVYSNVIAGNNKDFYMKQDATTCFGAGSFFDLFSQNDNSVVLMAGLNFNGPTLYHYYDQKYSANGRFVKNFNVDMILYDFAFGMTFDSFVKDNSFYNNKMNCLARFDALAHELEMVSSVEFGDNFFHLISESNFNILYKTVLEVDQEYFLLANAELWDTYYLKNNFDCMHGKIDPLIVSKIKNKLSF